jgi:RimJ/RimL family protein N-acetyltransferase
VDRLGSAAEETFVETARLRLLPLSSRFAGEYDKRECRTAEAHWSQHGFGHWAVLERRTGKFIGSAEVHFAYPGIEGISTEEIEVGIEILPPHRRQGYATEAVHAAVMDAWQRTSADVLVAYTRRDHTVSIKLMERHGFNFRSFGTGRDGDRISIYALRRRD